MQIRGMAAFAAFGWAAYQCVTKLTACGSDTSLVGKSKPDLKITGVDNGSGLFGEIEVRTDTTLTLDYYATGTVSADLTASSPDSGASPSITCVPEDYVSRYPYTAVRQDRLLTADGTVTDRMSLRPPQTPNEFEDMLYWDFIKYSCVATAGDSDGSLVSDPVSLIVNNGWDL